MEAAELDVALEELETRLERLRALYEQYFMGLEKIEPAIARKDVDRRIYVLRREKIRNTAKRFKLQTIIQRYNTFQQYWQRICREIENGTYKRHMLRAQKLSDDQLLTHAARRRLGRRAKASEPPQEAEASPPRSAPPPAAPTPERAAGAPAEPAAAAAPPAPPAWAKPPPPAKPAATKPAATKLDSLDLDMDFMGDWNPTARRQAPPKPLPATGAPSRAAPPKPAPPPRAPAQPPLPPPTALPRPAVSAGAARPAPLSRGGSIPPAPVASPPRPTASRPPAASPAQQQAPQPQAPALGAAPKPAPQRPLAARPAGAAPPAKPAAARAPAAPAKPPAAPGVDDTRLRDLHSRLQRAKQETKEGNVSFEGLARSIRATEAKLRAQHKNRKIEFDVVIKNGKAVVKPIVR